MIDWREVRAIVGVLLLLGGGIVYVLAAGGIDDRPQPRVAQGRLVVNPVLRIDVPDQSIFAPRR